MPIHNQCFGVSLQRERDSIRIETHRMHWERDKTRDRETQSERKKERERERQRLDSTTNFECTAYHMPGFMVDWSLFLEILNMMQ